MTRRPTRRTILKGAAAAAALGGAAWAGGSYWLGSQSRVSRAAGKKVIVIGIDGMDPLLCERMMADGRLPNLARLRDTGGFSKLGTSIPPQSPVAWASFINGAGPGSHGIFDFIHRHPEHQCETFFSAAETLPSQGGFEVGDHKVQFNVWPFNHTPTATVLRRQGEPFWDFLDAEGIPSTFYDLPSNYPPSPSQHGHHRCLCGMGTPDMLGEGSFGTYQHFADNGPDEPTDREGGKESKLVFERETARAQIVGPLNDSLKQPRPTTVEFLVHRDRASKAAVIEVQGHKIVLKEDQWSRWTKLDFELSMPWFAPNGHASGICRFYLQEVTPNFRLYVSPVNIDPSAPAQQISEPPSFVQDLSKKLGLFYTTGFQEDNKARSNNVFRDEEFARQTELVLQERLALFEHAVNDYDDGLLFFYFSSSDLQSHMFWWDSQDEHPIRAADEAQHWFAHIHRLYQKLDQAIGEVIDRYGSRATIIVMSDHGFANFGMQFNLNSWLRDRGYLQPADCTSIMKDVDWSQTTAYGLGINGLYINLKGRERDGTIAPGDEKEALLQQIIAQLKAYTDADGRPVISEVYRADKEYAGKATALAPDLIVGYARGFRASWETCLGDLHDEILRPNDKAWSADHCADARHVPGLLACNRPVAVNDPSLIDLAPSILVEYGLDVPVSMEGRNIFTT